MESVAHAIAVHSNLVECVDAGGNAVDVERITLDQLRACRLKFRPVHSMDGAIPGVS